MGGNPLMTYDIVCEMCPLCMVCNKENETLITD